jgi:hypothetical protein
MGPMPCSTLLRTSTVLLCVLLACSSDDGPSSTGTESDGSTSDPSTSSTTTDPSTTSDTTTSTTSTTDPSTTSTTSTTSDSDSSTGEEPPGICLGFDALGYLGAVLSRDAAEVGEDCTATPDPCGGDPVGLWDYELLCGADNLPNNWATLCPGATQQATFTNVTGTLEFEDNGAFTQQFTVSLDLEVGINVQSCFGITCAIFEGLLNDEDGLTATCTGPDNACACDVVFVGTDNTSGTYEIEDDTMIVFTVDGQAGEGAPFCVTDDRLDLWTPQYQTTITEETCSSVEDCEEALGAQNDAYACDIDDEGAAVPSAPWAKVPMSVAG